MNNITKMSVDHIATEPKFEPFQRMKAAVEKISNENKNLQDEMVEFWVVMEQLWIVN